MNSANLLNHESNMIVGVIAISSLGAWLWGLWNLPYCMHTGQPHRPPTNIDGSEIIQIAPIEISSHSPKENITLAKIQNEGCLDSEDLFYPREIVTATLVSR